MKTFFCQLLILNVCCLLLVSCVCDFVPLQHKPAQLLKNSKAFDDIANLPLIPSKTSTIYRAKKGEWQFNLHSYLIRYDGKFWAMWSSGTVNEADRGNVIRYATSIDGHTWTKSGIITQAPQAEDGLPGYIVARGLFTKNGKLNALVAFMDYNIGSHDIYKKGWKNLRLMRFEWEGKKWNNCGVFLDDCMNNYPHRPIKNKLFMTRRDGKSRKVYTVLSDSLKGENWTSTPLPGKPPADRMGEPSWFIGTDGVVHIIFRDMRREGFLYHSFSRDDGKTFSEPLKTNYPDTPGKNFCGKLSSGEYFLISNPGPTRDPLAITFSRNGWTFEKPAALRNKAPELRYEGNAKKSRTFQYPHAIEHAGLLWVIYATNKEDIEVSEFSLTDLQKAAKLF